MTVNYISASILKILFSKSLTTDFFDDFPFENAYVYGIPFTKSS